jgi:hypothetical protein
MKDLGSIPASTHPPIVPTIVSGGARSGGRITPLTIYPFAILMIGRVALLFFWLR